MHTFRWATATMSEITHGVATDTAAGLEVGAGAAGVDPTGEEETEEMAAPRPKGGKKKKDPALTDTALARLVDVDTSGWILDPEMVVPLERLTLDRTLQQGQIRALRAAEADTLYQKMVTNPPSSRLRVVAVATSEDSMFLVVLCALFVSLLHFIAHVHIDFGNSCFRNQCAREQ